MNDPGWRKGRKALENTRRAEGGDALIGEASTVNDDVTDNIFKDPIGRFAAIDEDEPPRHLLMSDYPKWLG